MKKIISNNLEKEVNDQFDDDDETILAGSSTPSNQSLASFQSAVSTNENNTFTSPDNSVSTVKLFSTLFC